MNKSLARKLLIYFVLLNLISILVIGAFSYTMAKDALLARTFDQLTSVRIEKKKRIESFFSQRVHEVEVIAGSLKNDLSEGFEPGTANHSILFGSGNYSEVMITGFPDVQLWAFENPGRQDISPNEAQVLDLPDMWQGDEDIVEYSGDTTKQRSDIFILKRVKADGTDHTMAFRLKHELIDEIMLDRNPKNGLGESGEAYLVGADHFLRSSSRFKGYADLEVKAETEGVLSALSGNTGTGIFDDYRGIPVLSSYSKIEVPGLEWVILAEIDLEEAMVPIRSFGYSMIYIVLLISLLLLGAVALLSGTITAPLRRLRRETERISSGIYEPLPDMKADGEIADLIQAFNHMTLKIKEQQRNLQETYQRGISAMIDGQEQERARLAREIHDGLAQNLLVLKMKLEHAGPGEAERTLLESQKMFSELMREIRSMSNGLMPAVLREFGLVRALEGLLKQVEESTEIRTILQVPAVLPELSRKAETYLFRIAQEAVNNILKHAGASEMSLSLTIEGDSIRLIITDDGIGLDPGKLRKDTSGIANIRERAAVLDGKVEFIGRSPRGLELRCTFPIETCYDEKHTSHPGR